MKASLQSQQRKGEESLIDATHHDAIAIAPIVLVADMAQGAGSPPTQQPEAEGPYHEKNRVEEQVQPRIQAAAAVLHERCREKENGEHRDGQELHSTVSTRERCAIPRTHSSPDARTSRKVHGIG